MAAVAAFQGGFAFGYFLRVWENPEEVASQMTEEFLAEILTEADSDDEPAAETYEHIGEDSRLCHEFSPRHSFPHRPATECR